MPLSDDTRLNPGPSEQRRPGAPSPAAPPKPTRWPLWLAAALVIALVAVSLWFAV